MVAERLLALASAAFLVCCGGGVEPYAAAPAEQAKSLAAGDQDVRAGSPSVELDGARGEGALAIAVGGAVPSFLGAVHAVVTDVDGRVIGGVDEDVADPEQISERRLALPLPAGEGYRLRLTATTSDPQPTTCRAAIDAFSVAAGATARLQVFSWDCEGVVGYVPTTAEPSDCSWLTDWAFVARTSASVGERIEVAAAAHDAEGKPARLRWSTPTPALGEFASPEATQTTFQCRSAGEDLALELVASDGQCAQHTRQLVACR